MSCKPRPYYDVHFENKAHVALHLEDVVELNKPAAVTQFEHDVDLVDTVLVVHRLVR